MVEKIFENRVLLSYSNASLSEQFASKREKKLLKTLKYILGINLAISIISTIIVSYFLLSSYGKENLYKILILTSYIISLVCGVFYIITLTIKKFRVITVLYYISSALSPIFFFNLRFPISSDVTHLLTLYIVLVELTLRIIILLIFQQSFLENLVFTLPGMCFLWAVYIPVMPSNIVTFYKTNFAFMTIGYLMLNSLVYVIDRRLRVSYFYRFLANRNSLWLKNVFETMDGGLVCIKDNKIKYINSFMMDILCSAFKENYRLNMRKENNTKGILFLN
jgi:hypothetical protein